MGDDRIEEMRKARVSDAVVLQEYNAFRSSNPDVLIFAVEGYDDVIFYDVMAEKASLMVNHESFVCKGKDMVLGLRRMLSRNLSKDADYVLYFVDHDYDHLKGAAPSDNIFCTDRYSIENYLVCLEVLDNLLRGEFRCSGGNGDANRKNAIRYFEKMLGDFFSEIRIANLALFYLRRNGLYGAPVDNDLGKYVKISEGDVRGVASIEEVVALVGGSAHLNEKKFSEIPEEVVAAFDALDPLCSWRGKFNYSFFEKLLKILKEDRGRKTPKIFMNKKRLDANFDGSIIRALTSACPLPESLAAFFQSSRIVQPR